MLIVVVGAVVIIVLFVLLEPSEIVVGVSYSILASSFSSPLSSSKWTP